MTEGLLSLQWNNHKFTLHQMLSSIRKKKSYTDTTLACDGLLYPVHKIVLSMCSKYFEDIFAQTQGQHPVIILKDIKRHELECLLNYMYIGEVNVPQEKLSGLIKAAECLQIKGLAVPDEAPPPNKSNKNIGEKRVRDDSHTSEAKKRKQEALNERSPRTSLTSSRQSTPSKDQDDRNNATSPTHNRNKIGHRNQQRNFEAFSAGGSTNSAINGRDPLSCSPAGEPHCSSMKEENDLEDALVEEQLPEAAIKEEPVYLSDSNSNDEHQMLQSDEASGQESSQLQLMEQLLGQDSAPDSLKEDFDCVEDSTASGDLPGSVVTRPLEPSWITGQLASSRSRYGNMESGILHDSSWTPTRKSSFHTGAARTSEGTTRSLDDTSSLLDNVIDGVSRSLYGPSQTSPGAPRSRYGTSGSLCGTSSQLLPPQDAATLMSSLADTSSLISYARGDSRMSASFAATAPPYSTVNFSECFTTDGIYVCPVCSKSFIQKYKLKRHYLIHTGEKPFTCSLCDFRCNQKNNLKLHIVSKHETHLSTSAPTSSASPPLYTAATTQKIT
ncbi:longitudinals lacking protein, isoforms H/M/V isoform X1 [Hyalella azteca]|uniref:Longitudinals lacking protein, isoforms H/M/V isoform X1 n=1 Tax=Hyalella azteca TaxID=294128 RepID=A0A8B7NV74_HYAAZ|nr:longitudinals lacking protein, isoforms H/M/V isoform X1 [Hyalella azteca]